MDLKKYESLLKLELKHPDFEYESRNTMYRKRIGRYWNKDGIWYRPGAENDEKADIYFLGDLLCQEKQIDEARTSNGFDFSYAFDFVRPLFQKADFVCANLVTPICNSAPYRNEKSVTEFSYYCNAPIEYLEAVAYSGVDAVITANNHDIDAGVIGLAETVEHAQNFGLIQNGTFVEDTKKYRMINVRGIKIALTSFTASHNKLESNLTKEGKEFLLNSYSALLAKEIYADAKTNGADLVITYIHAGIEYSSEPSNRQKKIVNDLSKIGYDAILCSHPHVLLHYDEIKVKNKTIPVIYSLGNFISNQQFKDTYLTCILKMHIERAKEKYTISCSYIPCCTVSRAFSKKYVVIPLCENAVKIIKENKLNEYRDRIQKALGEKITPDTSHSITNIQKITSNWKDTVIDENRLELQRERENQFALYVERLKEKVENSSEDICIADNFYYIPNYHNDTCKMVGYGSPDLRINIPALINHKKITEIEEYALSGNTCVNYVHFRDGCEVEKIPEGMCKDCTNLSLVRTIEGKKIRVIGEESFAGCKNLTGILLAEGIEIIENRAFADCINLRSVKIGANTNHISEDAFVGCPNLTIYGFANTYAEQYAKKLEIPFVCMEKIY